MDGDTRHDAMPVGRVLIALFGTWALFVVLGVVISPDALGAYSNYSRTDFIIQSSFAWAIDSLIIYLVGLFLYFASLRYKKIAHSKSVTFIRALQPTAVIYAVALFFSWYGTVN